MARPRSRRSFRGARRRTTWEQIISDFSLSTAATQSVLDISIDTIIDAEATGGTIKRMIGKVTIEHDPSAAAVESINLAIGIAVVTKDALAAGEVPDPQLATDQNQDWYWWDSMDHVVGPTGTQGGLVTLPINIRSMRRLRGGYRLAMIFHKQVSELGYRIHYSARNLWSVD